jgi:hypothetical protein
MGAISLGLGSWFTSLSRSQWIIANIPIVADFFSGISPISMVLGVVGAVIVAFGLLWGRWILAGLVGILFALGVFVITFWS